jgi:hypothetical protein
VGKSLISKRRGTCHPIATHLTDQWSARRGKPLRRAMSQSCPRSYPEDGEAEVRAAFASVMPVRVIDDKARAVADRLFFETGRAVHRAGEGAPYTGLKPAGTPVSRVIPIAEDAVGTGSAERLIAYLSGVLREELSTRLGRVRGLARTGIEQSLMAGGTWRPCWGSRCMPLRPESAADPGRSPAISPSASQSSTAAAGGLQGTPFRR